MGPELQVPTEPLELLTIGRSMPRERRQNGWVEKTGKRSKTWTGYWYVYEMVEGPGGEQQEKRREKCKVLGKCSELTKGAAEAKLLDLIREQRPPETGATFEQLASWYIRTNEGRWSRNWLVTVQALFKYHVHPRIGNAVAAELRRSDIQQALNAIAADPKSQSESLLQKCLTQVRAVFNFAIDDDLMEKNPALKVEMPPCRTPGAAFLTLEECQRLLDVCDERDRLILSVFMVCGLRPSELFALRVNDIGDSQFGTASFLRIDETIVKSKLSGHTKTKGSKASVPLSTELEAALRFYALSHGLSSEDFLFPSSSGTPMEPDNYLDRVLQPLGKLAGIPHLTHQILRRTTATHFQKHGTVKDAQTLLRHTDAQTTLKHYVKELPESVSAGVQSWHDALTRRKPAGRETVVPFPKKVANE
jgi:integrase